MGSSSSVFVPAFLVCFLISGISYRAPFYFVMERQTRYLSLSIEKVKGGLAFHVGGMRYPSEGFEEEMAIKCICGRCNNGDVSQLAK